MKDKVLQALKTKYKNLGFTDKAFDGVADYLTKTITEETQIETATADVESLLKAFQGETDKIRGEKANLMKELEELKAKQEGGKPAQPQTPKDNKDEMPEWAKAFMEENRLLKEQINNISRKSIAEERQAKFEEAVKGLSDKSKANELATFKRMAFKDDEDFNAFMEEKKIIVSELIQEEANSKLGRLGRPGQGGSGLTGEATDKEIADVVDNIKF